MRPRQIDTLGTFGAGGSGFGGGGSPIVLAKSAVPVSLVEPAVTFTNASPSSAAGGADTLLTSVGVHGLTAAVSVGASIYISGGTGWTVGFHKITAIAVDTTGTTIQIDTPFDAGFGVPTIALVDTRVTVASVQVPPLLANSFVRLDATFTVSPDASAGSGDCTVRLNGSRFIGIGLTGTNKTLRWIGGFANQGATNSQTGFFINGTSLSIGTTTVMPTTIAIDTSVPTTLAFTVQPSAANLVMAVNSYFVEVLL